MEEAKETMRPITIDEAYAVYGEQPTEGDPTCAPMSAEDAEKVVASASDSQE